MSMYGIKCRRQERFYVTPCTKTVDRSHDHIATRQIHACIFPLPIVLDDVCIRLKASDGADSDFCFRSPFAHIGVRSIYQAIKIALRNGVRITKDLILKPDMSELLIM